MRNVKGMFLVASRGGLIAFNAKGASFLFNPMGSVTAGVEVCGTRIFAQTVRDIVEFDHSGNMISSVSIPDRIYYPSGFAVLPGGDFAVFDCQVDSVYFLDSAGILLEAVAMPEASPLRLQIMSGIVRDGKLLISETGTGKIAEIDLTTYAAGVFKELDPPPHPWLGDINHLGRYYYVARWDRLQRFTEEGGLEDVAVFDDEYNVTGIAILRHYAYVTLNHAGKVYQVNLSSGKTKLLLEDVDYPVDIEFVPMVLETPPGEAESILFHR